jgi:hypothetical protein
MLQTNAVRAKAAKDRVFEKGCSGKNKVISNMLLKREKHR